MKRMDIYAPIHKGLRLEMGRLLTRMGQTDANDEAETAQLIADVRAFLSIGAVHLRDEEAVIHPALEAKAPDSTRIVGGEHEDHRKDFVELDALVGVVEKERGEARSDALHRLYLRFSRFVADDLEHLHHEETIILPLLHANFSDDELRGMERDIVALVPPAELITVLRYMIPAMNPAERLGFITDLKSGAPAEVFDAVMTNAARPTLSDSDWTRLTCQLEAA